MNLEQLLGAGYLCEELPPSFSSTSIGIKAKAILKATNPIQKNLRSNSTLCVDFSAPKIGLHRRHFSIPHPYPQLLLSCSIVKNWGSIIKEFSKSNSSTSVPEIEKTGKRAICYFNKFEDYKEKCIKASATKKYELNLDVSKYYFSIYTHSIPWAIHTKAIAKSSRGHSLWGNEIDAHVRMSQSNQTKGIPVGTDTSRIIAEIISAAIDAEFMEALHKHNIPLIGYRFVDDCKYFFDTLSHAEIALKEYQKILAGYSLHLNEEKTSIKERPCASNESWKILLNSIDVECDNKFSKKQRHALKNYFSLMITASIENPKNSVIKYAIKKMIRINIHKNNYDIFEPLFFNAALCESVILPDIFLILEKYRSQVNTEALSSFIKELFSQNLYRGHHFEMTWALHIAKSFEIKISSAEAQDILESNDPISILLLLDLIHSGLVIGTVDVNNIILELDSDSLYGEKWLLAYEAEYHSFLTLNNIDSNPFFSILKKNKVSFFNPNYFLDSSASTSIQIKTSQIDGVKKFDRVVSFVKPKKLQHQLVIADSDDYL